MEVGCIIGGKYRLVREVGEGAMGSVWAATHEVLGREVAIKFLLPTAESPETAAARFVAEAKAAARVKHRFVVDVFDFGITESGLYYMVQELLEGVPLADCMCGEPAWPLTEVLRFASQCLSGLEAVHQAGIIHRDLKPENIFVLRESEGTYPKLLDFGISKAVETSSGKSLPRPSLRQGRPRRLTGVGTTIGTPAYMSPEQLCNASTMDGRADLYSMGVILYEWLSGRVPFADTTNPTELYRRITARAATPLERLRPDLSSELCALIERALAPDPEQRFTSASAMRAEILRVLPNQRPVFSTVQRSGLEVSGPLAAMSRPRFPSSLTDAAEIPGLTRPWTGRWFVLGVSAGLVLLTAMLWPRERPPSSARAREKLLQLAEPERFPPSASERSKQAAFAEEPVPSDKIVEGLEPPDTDLGEPPPQADVHDTSTPEVPRPMRRRGKGAQGLDARPSVIEPVQAPEPASTPSTESAPRNTKVVRTLDF